MPASPAPSSSLRRALPVDAGWSPWAPRDEVAHRTAIDPTGGVGGGPALRVDARARHGYGGWRRAAGAVVSGRTYRVTACVRAIGLDQPAFQASVRLRWTGGDEGWQADYAVPVGRDGDWTRLEFTTQAPGDSTGVTVDCTVRLAGNATVWFDQLAVEELPTAPKRIARLASIYHHPKDMKDPAAAVDSFARACAGVKPGEIDLLCLPEGVSIVGTWKKYVDVAESVPGPTTAALGALAKRMRTIICAGLYERVGEIVYNTSVLIGRDGELIGTYRKTHLPEAEADGGLMYGDGFPVFDTDIGRIGMMICWDNQFPEVARNLAAAGAEIICLPIWGGDELLARARALENSVYVMPSSYCMPCTVIDPLGEVIAVSNADKPLAIAEVDLARRHRRFWVGSLGGSVWAERRADLSRPSR